MNSIASVTVLLNALATDLALADKTRALEQLRANRCALEGEYVST